MMRHSITWFCDNRTNNQIYTHKLGFRDTVGVRTTPWKYSNFSHDGPASGMFQFLNEIHAYTQDNIGTRHSVICLYTTTIGDQSSLI